MFALLPVVMLLINPWIFRVSRSETHLGFVAVAFDPQSFWHAGNRPRSVAARIGLKKYRHRFIHRYGAGLPPLTWYSRVHAGI